jgi:hypothetical protein
LSQNLVLSPKPLTAARTVVAPACCLTDNVKQRLFNTEIHLVRRSGFPVDKCRNDEELALKAVQTSAELLRQIDIAKKHIERAFRVQIEQNAGQ